MWIRVESFAPSSSPNTTPCSVLNLFCGRVEEQGVLFSLGRKSGDITFPTDKSVSRHHCVVRVRKNFQLVVENEGKAGTFIAEPQVQVPVTKPSGNDSDTDATDDEGIVSQRPSQKVASLGDGIVVDDVPTSSTTQHFWTQTSPIQMVKIDVGQSRILDFQTNQRSILIQVGLNGSTLQLTWVPFHVTFSRVPKQVHNSWKDKLLQIGATEDTQITSTTTHLITVGTVTVSAKPLTACCRGIPIVTPDYLQAVLDYSSSTDPPPSVNDYRAPFDKTMSVLEQEPANPKLMQGYLVLTLEPGEMDSLFRFSGATVVSLHSLQNDEERTSKAKEVATTSNEVVLVLSSRKRLFSKLTAVDGIYAFKAEAWAKAVYKQTPHLKDIQGNPIPLASVVKETKDKTSPLEMQVDNSDTDDETPGWKQSTVLQTQEALQAKEKLAAQKQSASDESPTKSPLESFSMMELHEISRKKRRRRGETSADEALSDKTPLVHQEDAFQDTNKTRINLSEDQSTKDKDFELDRVDHPMQEKDNDRSTGELQEQQDTIVRAPQPMTTNPQTFLSNADTDGWFVVAPKDDATRKALWKKASKMNAEQHEGNHFFPPAQSEQVVAIVSPSVPTNNDSSTHLLGRLTRTSNGPDFKRFRKNIVPRKVDDSELITLHIAQARESEQQLRLEENQRELEEQQRRADELFREIGGGTTRRRRR